jgi:epsilon-lactone hydrolase
MAIDLIERRRVIMTSKEYVTYFESPWPYEYTSDNLDECRKQDRDYLESQPFLFDNISVNNTLINGVNVEKTKTQSVTSSDVIIHIHGGAFFLGCPAATRDFVTFINHHMNITGYSIDYRLAPENKFPIPLEDCYQAYIGIIDELPEFARVFISGDSAGAVLALALVQLLKDRDKRLPDKVVLLSPSASFDVFYRHQLADLDKITGMLNTDEIYQMYCPDVDVKNPLISPIFSDFSSYPKVFLSVGTDETLFNDSVELYYTMKRKNVEIEFRIGIGMCHTYPAYIRHFPEATEESLQIVRFLKSK